MHASLSSYRALLIRYLRPQAAKVVVLAGLLMGSIALELVNPQIVRLFIDAATTHDTRTNLTVAAALFIGLSQSGPPISASGWAGRQPTRCAPT